MRIALIGNCQVQTMAALAGVMLEGAELRTFDYSQPYSRDEETRRRFADGLGDCDLIVAQTALLSHTGERDLRPRFGDKLLTVANFYFRGLFPDSCYIGDFAHRVEAPLAVHSVLVLDAFRRGLSEEEAVRQFDIEAMARLGLLDAWDASMAEMRRREANGVIDVPAAMLMEEACRLYPAFLTMNHPSAPLIADYLARVFDHAGIRYRAARVHAFPDPLAAHDTTPVLDEVAEYLGLPWRVSQCWKLNALDGRFVDRAEFVAACYDTYRALPPARLLAHSPTDLVTSLGADPALAYLVQADLPPGTGAPPPPRAPLGAVETVRAELARALHPLRTAVRGQAADLADIRLHTHKIHSFLEVIDPKVERLVQRMERMERREAEREAEAWARPVAAAPWSLPGLVPAWARRLLGRLLRPGRGAPAQGN